MAEPPLSAIRLTRFRHACPNSSERRFNGAWTTSETQCPLVAHSVAAENRTASDEQNLLNRAVSNYAFYPFVHH